MEKEIWKDILNFEGEYQISNLGRVKSLPRFKKRKEEKILKISKGKRGYYSIVLWKNQKSKTFTIHRLIACHFIPNPENKREVNHIDANKLNNNLSNLEWVTPKENSIHAIKSQNVMKYKGKRGVTKRVYKNNIFWISEISHKNSTLYLGISKDKEVAYNLYYNKYKELYGFYPW